MVKFLKILSYIFSLLVFQELFFRFFFPFPEVKNFNRIRYVQGEIGQTTAREQQVVRNTRLALFSLLDSPDEFIHTLNYYGFRGNQWKVKKEEGKKRFFFIGDSFVEGNMTKDDETIPKGFEKQAKENSLTVEAMNLGVSGGDWKTYMQLIADVTPLFKPDFIFLTIFANDSVDYPGQFPKTPLQPVYYNLYTPRIIELISMVQAKERLPFRWNLSKVYFNWNAKGFEKNLPPDKKIKKFVEPAVAEALKKRGFNPGLVNWPKRVKSFLSEPYDMLPQLRLINEVAKRNGAKLSVFYIPARNQVTNYYYQFEKQFCRACPPEMDLTTEAFQIHSKKLSSTCNALGIPFLDFSELIKNEEKKGNHLYWNYDIHMRNTGYLTLGEKIYDWWHERELKQTVK